MAAHIEHVITVVTGMEKSLLVMVSEGGGGITQAPKCMSLHGTCSYCIFQLHLGILDDGGQLEKQRWGMVGIADYKSCFIIETWGRREKENE